MSKSALQILARQNAGLVPFLINTDPQLPAEAERLQGLWVVSGQILAIFDVDVTGDISYANGLPFDEVGRLVVSKDVIDHYHQGLPYTALALAVSSNTDDPYYSGGLLFSGGALGGEGLKPVPAVHYPFISDLANTKAPADFATLTRAAQRSWVDQNGDWAIDAVDTPSFDGDGLIMESAWALYGPESNILAWGATRMTRANVAAPDGTNNAVSLAPTSVNGAHLVARGKSYSLRDIMMTQWLIKPLTHKTVRSYFTGFWAKTGVRFDVDTGDVAIRGGERTVTKPVIDDWKLIGHYRDTGVPNFSVGQTSQLYVTNDAVPVDGNSWTAGDVFVGDDQPAIEAFAPMVFRGSGIKKNVVWRANNANIAVAGDNLVMPTTNWPNTNDQALYFKSRLHHHNNAEVLLGGNRVLAYWSDAAGDNGYELAFSSAGFTLTVYQAGAVFATLTPALIPELEKDYEFLLNFSDTLNQLSFSVRVDGNVYNAQYSGALPSKPSDFPNAYIGGNGIVADNLIGDHTVRDYRVYDGLITMEDV